MAHAKEQTKNALGAFMRDRQYLVWYVKDPAMLSADSVVEHTLNYGEWSDVQELIHILGVDAVARIFRSHMQSERKKGNYHPEVRRYFDLYFSKHTPSTHRNSH